MSDQIAALWHQYAEARKAHESAQAAELRAGYAKKDAEQRLIDAMVENNMGSAEVGDCKFSLRKQVNISVTKNNEDLVRGWLLDTIGAEATKDYLEEKVKRFAVERMVKEGLREGKEPEDYPPFLNLYVRPKITVRGWDSE